MLHTASPVAATDGSNAPHAAGEALGTQPRGNDLGPSYIADGGTTDNGFPRLVGAVDIRAPGFEGGERWITIMDNGVEIGRVQADYFGDWSYQPEVALSQGEHHFTAKLTDYPAGLGESPTSQPYDMNVQPAPAAASAAGASEQHVSAPEAFTFYVTGENGILFGGEMIGSLHPVLRGVDEPGSWVTLMDSGHEVGKVQMRADGNWGISLPLGEGQHHLSAVRYRLDQCHGGLQHQRCAEGSRRGRRFRRLARSGLHDRGRLARHPSCTTRIRHCPVSRTPAARSRSRMATAC